MEKYENRLSSESCAISDCNEDVSKNSTERIDYRQKETLQSHYYEQS